MERKEWLKARKQGIGSSDVAAVLGVSKYRTPYQVWLDKTTDEVDETETEATYWGKKLEAVIAEAYAERTGRQVQIDVPLRKHNAHPALLASLDRVILPASNDQHWGILECKTASSYVAKQWEHGVPVEYYLQVQHQLSVTGWQWAEIALLVDGRDFQTFPIARDAALIAQMEAQLVAWWQQHVVAQVPPPRKAPDLQGAVSTPETVEASEEVLQGYTRLIQLDDAISELEAKREHEKARLQEAMGQAEVLTYSGNSLATWKSTPQNRFDAKRFQAENKALYEKYLTKTLTRRFCLK